MKNLLLLLLLFSSIISEAQFRGNNWAVSDSVLINFSQSGNTISNSAIHSTDYVNEFVEPMATMSDNFGQLLFYTNGFTVWNKNHQIMLNGDNLQCDYSMTNGVLIVPYPEHDSLYYIVYIKYFPGKFGISYSIVNMNLENGLGAISSKNIPKTVTGHTLTEKLAAVKHGNGRDWWVIVKGDINNYCKFLITPDSILEGQWESIGVSQKNFIEGEMCFSKDGNKLGLVNSFTALILDFNRCTGELSNEIILDTTFSSPFLGYYGCSFSNDGNKFYASNSVNFFQYNLSLSNPSLTKTLIWSNPYYTAPPAVTDSTYYISQHELAPDGKIYISTGYALWPDKSHYSFQDLNLSIINNPDSLGIKCNFNPWSLYLGGHRITAGLPNMPNYNLGVLKGSSCDTLYTSERSKLKNEKSIVRIFPNPAQDELTIEVLNGIAPDKIEVTDALGRVVLQFIPHKPNSQLNIHSLATGVYFIKVRMGDGSLQLSKFVKE